MNNTVIYENPLRKKLKQAMTVLMLLVLMFAVVLILINLINKQNYNGKTNTVQGAVTKISKDGDIAYIHIDASDKKYNTNPIAEEIADLESLVGKNVIIVTPENQFGNGDPFVLGLSVDGKEVVDAEQTIEKMRGDNTTVIIIMAVLCGVCAAGTCAAAVWRINVPRDKQYPLGQKYVEYYADKQPNCPETKYWKIFLCVWVIAVILPIVTIGIVNEIKEQSDTVNFIFVGIVCAIILAGAITFIPLKKWIEKKNVQFYAERYPFDFADISHIRMKKDLREKIEKEMREDLEMHPHYQGDGGNGYLAKFTENGVELYVPDFWEEEREPATEPAIDVPAEDVFALQENETSDSSPTENEQGLRGDENKTPVLTLTYEETNFEAVPYLIKPRPLFVVIKSRLAPNERYPEELVNDLHFLLDVNLLKTLQTFDVPVENLDDVLQNKKQMMTDALTQRKRKNKESI
ncbi:MAG: hypothetical protein NC132_01930 [Corallococcus sp.]|nr:hypothetical protein [Corallococcus sp.]MCM1359417.1 hypothetical protein [Corallococcus sp.]MCM1394860.1 hypothetical protein [Corallococcus sp.]